jgi:hypothetical protein
VHVSLETLESIYQSTLHHLHEDCNGNIRTVHVRFEASTVVTMKNAAFWDVVALVRIDVSAS